MDGAAGRLRRDPDGSGSGRRRSGGDGLDRALPGNGVREPLEQDGELPGRRRRVLRVPLHADDRRVPVLQRLDDAVLRSLFPDATPVALDDGLRATVDWFRTLQP